MTDLWRCENGHGWHSEDGPACPTCGDLGEPVKVARGNKYAAVRTWSDICQRWFASRLEARRGEYLTGLQNVGAISQLEFQVRFVLSLDPRVSYVADFRYLVMAIDGFHGPWVIEDTKGKMTDASKVKLAWMAANGNQVTIVKKGDW